MALKDKEKWERKYKESPELLEKRKPSEKLKKLIALTKGKNALEIACGSGRNSIYLAENNFQIDAMDISNLALTNIDKENYHNINTIQMDLEGYTPSISTYNLIVKINYLDRQLIPHLSKALKKDGILLIETYMESDLNTKAKSNSNFLLKEEELKSFFTDKSCEIIEYDEFDNDLEEKYRMKKQSIIVKKL